MSDDEFFRTIIVALLIVIAVGIFYLIDAVEYQRLVPIIMPKEGVKNGE